jgi:hypothetical protein
MGRLDFEIDPAADSCRLYRLCEAYSGEVPVAAETCGRISVVRAKSPATAKEDH